MSHNDRCERGDRTKELGSRRPRLPVREARCSYVSEHSPVNSLRYGHQLENVPIEILEVDPSAAIPIVEFRIVERPRSTPEGEPGSLHPLQDRIEFGVADVERIMMALESFYVVVEKQGESFVDTHRREVAVLTLESEQRAAQKNGQKPPCRARERLCD